jgi:hypothetical protein
MRFAFSCYRDGGYDGCIRVEYFKSLEFPMNHQGREQHLRSCVFFQLRQDWLELGQLLDQDQDFDPLGELLLFLEWPFDG